MRFLPDEYVSHCYRLIKEYITGVQDGSIITNKWVKLIIQRYLDTLSRKDIELRIEEPQRVFKFLSLCNLNINNKYQQFIPLPFQAFFIWALFSPYYKGTNIRLYNTAFLFMGRKNGKSAFSALLQLYFLLADGVIDAQSILVASSREQAHRVFDFAKGIVNAPHLHP